MTALLPPSEPEVQPKGSSILLQKIRGISGDIKALEDQIRSVKERRTSRKSEIERIAAEKAAAAKEKEKLREEQQEKVQIFILFAVLLFSTAQAAAQAARVRRIVGANAHAAIKWSKQVLPANNAPPPGVPASVWAILEANALKAEEARSFFKVDSMPCPVLCIPEYKTIEEFDAFQRNRELAAARRPSLVRAVALRSRKTARLRRGYARQKDFFTERWRSILEAKGVWIDEDANKLAASLPSAEPVRRPRASAGTRGGGGGNLDDAAFQRQLEKNRRVNKCEPTELEMNVKKRRLQSWDDQNRRIEDPMSEEEQRMRRNPWTQEECEIFDKKFARHRKNFGKIASFLPRKTVQETVEHFWELEAQRKASEWNLSAHQLRLVPEE
jgi:hypothetical protein